MPAAMSKWQLMGARERPRALLLPSLLALASVLCWRRPEKTVAILSGGRGRGPFGQVGPGLCPGVAPGGGDGEAPAAPGHVHDLRLGGAALQRRAGEAGSGSRAAGEARTTEELLRNERSDVLLEAASEAMRKAMSNKQVQSALKETVIDALQDDQLQQQLIATLTKAAILSSGDRLLRSHLLDVGKDAIVRALKDEGFTQEMVHMLSRAVLAASQNAEIRDQTRVL